MALHLIADNDSTHKHARVKACLARHPRFHMHFVPASGSWLNRVERCFCDLSEDAIGDGSFRSMRELTLALESYLGERNLHPKPYCWSAEGEDILGKIRRAREATASQVA
ncbi:MAG: transposase [Burkholderiales bacterium]|nr:transposase [Burkholderiales bacterium]